MRVLDALKALWILGVFLCTFWWLPAHLFLGRANSPRVIKLAGNGARMVLCVTIAVLVLSSLKVLGAITVVSLFCCAILVSRSRKHAGMLRYLLTSLQATTINIMRQLESRSFGLLLQARTSLSNVARQPWGLDTWLRALEGKQLLSACFLATLGTTVVLQSEHAVRELRFDQPEQYSALLRARELMLNIHPVGRPFIFPAMVAATSLLSGTDAMQVTRFLTPAIGVLLVLGTGLLIQACGRTGVACLAPIYCLGAAAFPPVRDQTEVAISAKEKIENVFSYSPALIRARPEFALGSLFVLLGLVILADWYRNSRGWDSLVDFTCCFLLAGMFSQVLLVIMVMAAAFLLLRPMAGLFAFVMLCYGMTGSATLFTRTTIPDEMRTIVPIAAALLVGWLLVIIEGQLASRGGKRTEAVLLAICLSVAALWLRPQRLSAQCLEYEAAARATQEIAYRFPRQTWVVAAPVEQLSETLGLGGHEDLAGFVEKYRNQVSSREFRFPDAREDLFIYVEKRPFQIFSREPETVSFSVLTDPTYRNYRSPGGRASLEAAALELCESYRQHHSDISVFFENDVLRIYHIHRQPGSGSEPGD
jgi:hypothetical protein